MWYFEQSLILTDLSSCHVPFGHVSACFRIYNFSSTCKIYFISVYFTILIIYKYACVLA